MSGVYNRKLFRQSNSRNAFHGMGGIMSSSNELMQQAMQTANNAPMPADLGPLQLKPQSAMPQPQAEQPEAIPYDPSQAGMPPPDQGMPAEPAPPDPMGQMQGQAPVDPMQQQPMGAPPEQAPPQELAPMQDAPFMPPGTPPSVAGYQDGGFVLGRFGGQRAQAEAANGPIDIGVTAGTVEVPKLTADAMAAIAAPILAQIENKTPEETATSILAEAEKSGIPTAGDPKIDLMSLYTELTGDPEATNKTIDDLNRGILGAAIAAGKSPRATENIANGMLVGLQAMKETETARANQAAQAQYGLLTAGLAPKTSGNTGIADDYSASRTWKEAYDGIMKQDVNSLDFPTKEDGTEMSQLEYANMVADLAVIGSKSPEDLVGTMYEGLHKKYANPAAAAPAAAAPAAAAPAAAAAAAPAAKTALLAQARAALDPKNKSPYSPAEIKQLLVGNGFTPEEIKAELGI